MLNILFNPLKAERHPLELFLVGIFYSSLSVILGVWIFNKSASLAIVFLTVISCLYIVQGAIRIEEKKEKNYLSERWILNEHKRVMFMILSLFLGFTVSFMLWSFFLPPEITETVFSLQKVSVEQIKAITGNTIFEGPVIKIFLNNINIVFISLVFALFYGAGAVYILTWNASVMGYVMGTLARETVGLTAIPLVMTKYFLHGIPEMIAYILAAISGGILYFAFIKGDLTKKDRVKRILMDVFVLVLLSIFLLFISVLIEVYISTLL